jgi:hypothetical protein
VGFKTKFDRESAWIATNNMNIKPKITESRILWGGLLILAGILFLIQNLGFLRVGDLFWALLLLAASLFLLSLFIREKTNWWALIPGLTLLGIAAAVALSIFAPRYSDLWSGSIVLGGIGLGFLGVYIAERRHWWAIIPCGVLLTLAASAGLAHFINNDMANLGVFFLGIGVTFSAVALLPSPQGEMTWAWIPAGILLVLGGIFLVFSEKLLNYLWPLALILLGAFLILRTLRRKS